MGLEVNAGITIWNEEFSALLSRNQSQSPESGLILRDGFT